MPRGPLALPVSERAACSLLTDFPTTYRQIPIRYVDVELEDTLAIAARYAIDAYDAYLIRCGLKFSAPLLSLDQGLLQVAEKAGVHTIEAG